MIGIDTNILVRYLVRDDPAQTEAASALLESLTANSPGIVQPVVLCEIVWVLESAYGYAKPLIVQALRQLLVTQELRVPDYDLAWAALRRFQEGTADFSDYLIQECNRAEGCVTTYTFDKKAAKSVLATLLAAR